MHKLFKDFVNELNNASPNLAESISEVSHLIPEPRIILEATRLSADIKRSWLKATFKEIKKINQQ